MEFSPDDAPVSEADFRFRLHLSPSSATVLLLQTGDLPDACADGDGLYVRNLFQDIKIGHRATTSYIGN